MSAVSTKSRPRMVREDNTTVRVVATAKPSVVGRAVMP